MSKPTPTADPRAGFRFMGGALIVATVLGAGLMELARMSETTTTPTNPRTPKPTTPRAKKVTPEITRLMKRLTDSSVGDANASDFLSVRYKTLAKLAQLGAELDYDQIDSLYRELGHVHRHCALELKDATSMRTEIDLCLRFDPEEPNEDVDFVTLLRQSQVGKILAQQSYFDEDKDFDGIARILKMV